MSENNKMKLRCITITSDKKIPMLDQVTVTENNILYLDNLPYSNLNNINIFNEVELKYIDLGNYIFAISINEDILTNFDDKTKMYGIYPVYPNIKFINRPLWGDIVVLKIVDDKIYELTIDEVDDYINVLNRN